MGFFTSSSTSSMQPTGDEIGSERRSIQQQQQQQQHHRRRHDDDCDEAETDEIMGTICNDNDKDDDDNNNGKRNRNFFSFGRRRTTILQRQHNNTSFCGRLCNCLWRILSLFNSAAIVILVYIVLDEAKQIQDLQAQIPAVEQEIGQLEEEVKEKQEVQIEELHEEVQQEHNLTFLTLAGIFTLLTCLISMFHMSSHLQKMNQPTIQRKIVAILWMSPIYSVTSFLSLIYPPAEGYLAIIKDFYESYCIYTFLAFLIVVLGQGSREGAVQVLAKHANHLERPTRLLSRWYHPPPDTSDEAKANAVLLQCQIFAMQFVFIRPLTTILSVWHSHFAANNDDNGGTSSSGNNAGNGTTFIDPDNNSTLIDLVNTTATLLGGGSSSSSGGSGSNGFEMDFDDSLPPSYDNDNNNGTRWLDWRESFDFVTPSQSNHNSSSSYGFSSPTFAPIIDSIASTSAPAPSDEFMMTMNGTDTTSSSFDENDLRDATKAYFKSFSFFLAMVVNISVFVAFTGLLKFYHAVHHDLKWCRPWPKFLTIKGVVFLTFWQGLMIVIAVNYFDTNNTDDPSAQATKYQNIVICCEMLFFSITHWCVFPAEEWEKDYKPPQTYNKPGIGIQDFVSDVGYIVQSGRSRRKARRRRTRRFGYGGIYQRPHAAAAAASSPTATSSPTTITSPTMLEEGLHGPTATTPTTTSISTDASMSVATTTATAAAMSLSPPPPEDDDDDEEEEVVVLESPTSGAVMIVKRSFDDEDNNNKNGVDHPYHHHRLHHRPHPHHPRRRVSPRHQINTHHQSPTNNSSSTSLHSQNHHLNDKNNDDDDDGNHDILGNNNNNTTNNNNTNFFQLYRLRSTKKVIIPTTFSDDSSDDKADDEQDSDMEML